MQKITKAILPVAGFGTRFLPATKAQPKEMLPVVDKPVVQYIVEELVAAGIEEIIFITGRGKRAIEDHFDVSFELEETLVEKNKHELLEEIQKISKLAKFTYVRQPFPLGDGHAILQARHLMNDEPVVVAFGDCLYDAKISPTKQMMDTFEKYGDVVIGLSQIERSEISKFGIVEGVPLDSNTIEIKKFVEKPTPDQTQSNLAAPGRYIITPELVNVLAEIEVNKTEEMRLANAFNIMLTRNRPLYGRILEGEWLDTGDKFNFMKAAVHMGLKHPEIGDRFKEYLKTVTNKLS